MVFRICSVVIVAGLVLGGSAQAQVRSPQIYATAKLPDPRE
jgi:hypothetical protein